MSVATPPSVTTKNTSCQMSRHCQMSLEGQNHFQLRTASVSVAPQTEKKSQEAGYATLTTF